MVIFCLNNIDNFNYYYSPYGEVYNGEWKDGK